MQSMVTRRDYRSEHDVHRLSCASALDATSIMEGEPAQQQAIIQEFLPDLS
jgi:hypothetical protein